MLKKVLCLAALLLPSALFAATEMPEPLEAVSPQIEVQPVVGKDGETKYLVNGQQLVTADQLADVLLHMKSNPKHKPVPLPLSEG